MIQTLTGVIEEIADVGRLTPLHRQSEELSEDTLIGVNEEGHCKERANMS